MIDSLRDGMLCGLRRRLPRALAWSLALWLPVSLAACSGINPFGGASDQSGDAEEEPYPNLARVPSESPRPTPDTLRESLVEGLVADHASARYSGDDLTPRTAAVAPAAPPPPGEPRVEIRWETLRVASEVDRQAQREAEAAAKAAAEQAEAEMAAKTEEAEPDQDLAMDEEPPVVKGGPELVAVIYFAQESAQLDQDDEALLEDVIAMYKERGGLIRLVGHARAEGTTDDEVAQRMVDLDLSLKRANAVASSLMDLGAKEDAVLVEAKAEGEPVVSEATASGDTGERRVEVFLEY